jgi:hypothetical protein
MRTLGLFFIWGALLGTVLIALFLAIVGGIFTVLFLSPFLIGAMIVGLIIGVVLVISAPRPVTVTEVRYVQGPPASGPPHAHPWPAPTGPPPLPRPVLPAGAGGIDMRQPVEIAPGLWRKAGECSRDDLAAAAHLLRIRRREGPHRPFGSG